MVKLITVKKAREEIVKLKQYIKLIESYETDTIEKRVIKEYAITNSILEVVNNLRDDGYLVDKDFVGKTIRSRGKDDLHKFIRSGYMAKTKHQRRG